MVDLLSSPQGLSLMSAGIGASAAILGQIFAGIISILRDSHLENKRNLRAEKLAAVEALVALDRLVDECHEVAVRERLIIAPDDPLDIGFECQLPAADRLHLQFFDKLDAGLAGTILRIRMDLSIAIAVSSTNDLTPPAYGNIVSIRKSQFAKIGAQSTVTAIEISRAYGLSVPDFPLMSERAKDFAEILEDILDQERIETERPSL